MRTFSLVLLGLAVGAALLSRSPSRPAPTPPEPAASAPALAELEAVLADGTRIEAHGENKFPPNYRDVMSALDDLTAAAQKNALQQYTP